MRVSGARTRVSLWVLILVASVTSLFPALNVYAVNQLTTRSDTLSTSAPSTSGSQTFGFTTATTANIGSIGFVFCTTASGTCTTPAGLVTTSATLTSVSSGFTATGWSVVNTTAGAPYITRGSAVSIPTSTAGTVVLGAITNPSTANKTFFVRITTYTGTDGATGPTDAGNVAASTATPIVLTGTMPEYLQFCTAVSVGVTSGVPDCTTATSGAVAFNQLFDPSTTATATSQMAAASNAGSGFSITYYGQTLQSGGNSITAQGATAGTVTVGKSQFGLNTVANTTPAVGTAVSNPGISGNTYNGQSITPYNTANNFAFVPNTATAVANSNGHVSDLQIYTVSYIVDVNGSQPAGTYTTTLTYVCTPTY